MKDLLLVGIGGLVGSMLRYKIGLLSLANSNSTFPWGTLIVNLAGSLLIGILFSAVSKNSTTIYLLMVTGFCGGFTTFSTFSLENVKFIQSGNFQYALSYTGISILGGLILCGLGYFLSEKIS